MAEAVLLYLRKYFLFYFLNRQNQQENGEKREKVYNNFPALLNLRK